MFGNPAGSITAFLESNNNSVVNNFTTIRQVEETCIFIENGKKCSNQFQEKCNLCQYMFCRVHLFVQERYFLCYNCESIYKTQKEVETKFTKCTLVSLYCSFCFCIGGLGYCSAAPFCLTHWSKEAHKKYQINSVCHRKCKGFEMFCGLYKIECTGHGPERVQMDEKSIESSTMKDIEKEVRQPLSPGNKTVITKSNNNEVYSEKTGGNETVIAESNHNLVRN